MNGMPTSKPMVILTGDCPSDTRDNDNMAQAADHAGRGVFNQGLQENLPLTQKSEGDFQFPILFPR
ncbi:hypothetical protein CCP3SC15_1190001 [Gammaproteobacteria bacterium]